jgi:hypothetical protein
MVVLAGSPSDRTPLPSTHLAFVTILIYSLEEIKKFNLSST